MYVLSYYLQGGTLQTQPSSFESLFEARSKFGAVIKPEMRQI